MAQYCIEASSKLARASGASGEIEITSTVEDIREPRHSRLHVPYRKNCGKRLARVPVGIFSRSKELEH